jgi:hypothetical protein
MYINLHYIAGSLWPLFLVHFVSNVGPEKNIFYCSFALSEHACSVKSEKFLDQLNDCQIITGFVGFEVIATVVMKSSVFWDIIIIIIIIYLNCKWVSTRWHWYYNKTQHTNNTHHTITHHTQTKHSTQNYTNNIGCTTHTEYNANTIKTTIKLILIRK